MKQLKDTVERIVHPILAGDKRKNKMREELLAHLTEIYNEELAKGATENTALQQTLQRFGNTSVIQRDLQSSVPFYERIPQIVRSLTFAIFMYLIWAIVASMIFSWENLIYNYRNPNLPFTFTISPIVLQIEPICFFILVPLVFSYLSRILSTRPLFYMTFQFLFLEVIDWFLWMFIKPRFKMFSMEMGFSYSIIRIYDCSFLLANILCIFWIWKSFKRKEMKQLISSKANNYRNISAISGILSILILNAFSSQLFPEGLGLMLCAFLMLNSVLFCILSYWQEKTVHNLRM